MESASLDERNNEAVLNVKSKSKWLFTANAVIVLRVLALICAGITARIKLGTLNIIVSILCGVVKRCIHELM